MLNESWSKSSHSAAGDCVEAAWRKASYSTANGQCVEVGWHKPDRSGAENCVEAGQGDCGMVHVRDTKDRDGGELAFSPGAWMQFLGTLK